MNGKKQKGQCQDDKPHGQGTLIYLDGQTFKGQFVNGSEHGEGICTDPKGETVECRVLKKQNVKVSTKKNRHDIFIKAKKWIVLEEYELLKGKGKEVVRKLENSFKRKAKILCSSKGNFEIVNKKIEVLEVDEVPAFGLEPKAKLAISGIIECTQATLCGATNNSATSLSSLFE